LSSVFIVISLLLLLFSLFFIGLLIPTVTWLRSGVRLTGLSFILTGFKGFWITRNHYSEYSFILITDFTGWRIISPLLNEIPLLPRCGFLVICPRYFSFFRVNTEFVMANSFICPSIVGRCICTIKWSVPEQKREDCGWDFPVLIHGLIVGYPI